MFQRFPRMLRQIESLSHDPEAAELVQSSTQVAAAMEQLLHLQLMALAMQERELGVRAELVHGLRGLMLMSTLASLQGGESSSSGQRALSEEALRRLPEQILCQERIEEMRDPTCVVCFEPYVVGHRVLQLPCEHMFCSECGREWLRRNCTCPVCRKEVDEEESDDDGLSLLDARPAQGSALAAVRSRAREAESESSGSMSLMAQMRQRRQLPSEPQSVAPSRIPSQRLLEAMASTDEIVAADRASSSRLTPNSDAESQHRASPLPTPPSDSSAVSSRPLVPRRRQHSVQQSGARSSSQAAPNEARGQRRVLPILSQTSRNTSEARSVPLRSSTMVDSIGATIRSGGSWVAPAVQRSSFYRRR